MQVSRTNLQTNIIAKQEPVSTHLLKILITSKKLRIIQSLIHSNTHLSFTNNQTITNRYD